MEPPSSRTRLVVAESNLRGFRGLTVDAFGCLLRGGPGQLPNAMRKIVGAREETRNVQSPEDLWRDTFRRYIRANPFLSFREVHRKTIQDFFKALGISEDVDGSIDAAFDEYRSSSAYPEVSAVLRDVEQEVPVAVISNMDTTALLGALQRNGLTFTFIITSDEEQRYKPDPSPFQRAVRYLGLPAANVLHVGSSYAEDIVGASLTGMPALLMQRPGAPEEPRGEAQGTVHDLQQVNDFIRNSWKES
ncbi:MAG: HAD family hydrolase [Methanobacteriota archaeon]|nr:MAG: HAD family hydrolase [Euryarchaeota archaeon]